MRIFSHATRRPRRRTREHVADVARIQAWLRATPDARKTIADPFQSTNPAFLEHTAQDLALATQSHIDQDLAQAISRVYAIQQQLDDATHAATLVMYEKSGEADRQAFLVSMDVYFGDCT